MKLHKQHERLEVTACDVSGSMFDDVNLSGSSYHDVNLSGGRYEDVNLSGSTFSNANMTGWKVDDVNFAGLALKDVRAKAGIGAAVLTHGQQVNGHVVGEDADVGMSSRMF